VFGASTPQLLGVDIDECKLLTVDVLDPVDSGVSEDVGAASPLAMVWR
jgi:hypothetical protein